MTTVYANTNLVKKPPAVILKRINLFPHIET
jgi:hypothetical protein